ncbi:hypothetical protein OG937_46200 [Streptomyces sp. NBC_00510]
MTTTAPTGAPPPARPRYENWRPPIVGVSLLAPVGANGLVLADVTGHGYYVLPHGTVDDGQTPEDAARAVLAGQATIRRQVAVINTQGRRRRITTHLVVTDPLNPHDIARLDYQDPRAVLRVLPTPQAIAALPPRASEWALLGLQALAIGVLPHLENGAVKRLEAVAVTHGCNRSLE